MTHAFFAPLVLRTSRETPTVLKPLGSVVGDYLVRSTWEAVSAEDDTKILGSVNTCQALLMAAADEHVEWGEVVADGPVGMAELYVHMFDEETGDYSDDFLINMGSPVIPNVNDLFYVESDLFMGEPWGPQALRVLAQHFGHCTYLVVRLSDTFLSPDSAVNWAAAVVRKARLEAMGFKRLPDSLYMVLDLTYVVADLPEGLAHTYA